MSYMSNLQRPEVLEREVSGVGVGTIVEFPYGKMQGGYLKPDGGKYDRRTYPDLYNYLGTETLPLREHECRVGDVKWFSNRNDLDPDFVPSDGQQLPSGRELYKELWSKIQSGLVHKVAEDTWKSDPNSRASYTEGSNNTDFRVPDLNGKSEGSLGALVLRGDGKNAGSPGIIQGDAIRNITGRAIPKNANGQWSLVGDFQGAMRAGDDSVQVINYDGGTVKGSGAIILDASLVVPTAPENRMVNTSGCWAVRVKYSTEFAIKAAGYVENDGVAKLGLFLKEINEVREENLKLKNELSEVIDKPVLFAERRSTWALGAGESGYVPFDYVRISEKIKALGDFFQVEKAGLYKVTYSLTKDGGVHQMLQIDGIVLSPDGNKIVDSIKVGINYNGTVSGAKVESTWMTTSGTVYFRLLEGQRVGINVTATNNLPGVLYSPGNYISIEYIKP